MLYGKLELQVKNVQRASRELMEVADAELKEILLDATGTVFEGTLNDMKLLELLQDTNNVHALIVKLSNETMNYVVSARNAVRDYDD